MVEGDARDFSAKEFEGVDLLESKDNETVMKDLAMAKMLHCRIRSF